MPPRLPVPTPWHLGPTAVALALLGACDLFRGGEPEAPAEGSPVEAPAVDRTLVVAIGAGLSNLLPPTYETNTDAMVLDNLVAALVDYRFDCGLEPVPRLATSWEVTEGGRVLTFHLRDDLTWSDGTPVTAIDVVHTFERLRDPEVNSPRASYAEGLLEGSPSAPDPHTVVFAFAEPAAEDTLMAQANLMPMPAHALRGVPGADLREHALARDPLVSGPWRLAELSPDERAVLEPNPAFTGPDAWKPHLDRVVLRVLPDPGTRLLALEHGEVDVLPSITVPEADRLKAESPGVQVVRRGFRFLDYVAWNLSDPRFEDVRVRRALTLAVDIPALIRDLQTDADGTAYAKPAVGTVTPELCDSTPEVEPLPHDLDAARALLAEAGWTDSDGDGVVDKGGRALAFTLLTTQGDALRADLIVRLQAMWKRLGVAVDLRKIDKNAFYAQLRQRDFEAALAGWSAQLFVDPSNVWHGDTTDRTYAYNFTGYSDPVSDALIEAGLSTRDPAEAAAAWRELQARVYAAQPYTFLWWRDELAAVSPRVARADIDLVSALHHLETWRVRGDDDAGD